MRRYLMLFLLSASLLCSITRISMTLNSNVEFDLSLALYPPLVFPAYYYPTSAAPQNPQGIRLRVRYQRRGPGGHTVSTLYLLTRASGDFSSTIFVDQLYFAPDGELLPSPGVDPPGGNWRAYSTLYQQLEQFPVVGNNQTFDRFQDYVFQSESDDEPTNSSITLYYRVFGL